MYLHFKNMQTKLKPGLGLTPKNPKTNKVQQQNKTTRNIC